MTGFLARTVAHLRKMQRHERPDAVLALHAELLNLSVKISTVIFALLFAYVILTANLGDIENLPLALLATAIYLPAYLGVLILNRRGQVRRAGWLFVLAMFVTIVISDAPAQLIEGRSTLWFVAPIVIAGLVINPLAPFLLAALSSLALYALAWISGLVFEPMGLSVPFTALVFFLIAALMWFAMSRLERAILDLQDLSRGLERRVAERTRELTLANQQLKFMNERLLQHDRARSSFVSMVSHDLRAPLGAILSNTEILTLRVLDPLSDNQANGVRRIEHNARSLLRLVDDLLDQSRIEAGQILTLRPVRFAPKDLLAETISALGDLALAKGVVLTTELSPDLPSQLFGDPQRLLQILLNLTANAIKFTDAGLVQIKIGRQDVDHWWLRVSDSGRGIPPDEQAHIFEPFQRGATAGSLPGAGLGLSIVNHLVALMNGEIQLESEEQCGSTFTVLLPLAP